MWDEDLQLTLKLENTDVGITIIVTLVYAKCTATERMALW